MLTQVEVRNAAGALLTLVLDDIADGYVLKDIDGLDPVKATITSSSFANLDGVQFQNAVQEARHLIIKLGLEPDFVTTTSRSLRNNLYKWFMTKALVNMRFFDSEGPTVEVEGHVEDLIAPLFTKEPSADIYITCEEPDLVELTPVTDSENTVSTTTEFLVEYNASAETGIKFTLHLDRSLSQFIIYHRTPDNQVKTLQFDGSLVNLDTLTIDTNVGSKGAILTRSGVQSSVLYGVDDQSTWFQLQQGDNYFRFYATGAAIPFDYEFTRRHGGL